LLRDVALAERAARARGADAAAARRRVAPGPPAPELDRRRRRHLAGDLRRRVVAGSDPGGAGSGIGLTAAARVHGAGTRAAAGRGLAWDVRRGRAAGRPPRLVQARAATRIRYAPWRSGGSP